MSSFHDTVEAIWRENRLFTVLLELTYRCNLDCFFCYNDVGLRGTPLRKEDYFRLLEDLASLGTLQLSLSGGEPLAHPDFFAIGARARELGFVVRIKSNGHALRGTLARRVRDEIDPYSIEVSLHGAVAETHDRQTRVPGSFARLIENLTDLRELGLRVKINSTLTSYNEGEIEGMFEIADRLGFPLQVDPDVTPRDNGDLEPLTVRASKDGIQRLFELQSERGRARAGAGEDGGEAVPEVMRQGDADVRPPASGKHCGAGSSNIAIDPYGNVYPCVQWRRPVGNLHDRSIREIWTGSSELESIRRIATEIPGRLAGSGPNANLLNFCPGAAELATGDAGAVYDAAAMRRDLLTEMNDRESKRSRLPVIR
ncbi:MAG: radical SAM/SPASM domain-containing protein [Thermoanaerobaculia bacterium]